MGMRVLPVYTMGIRVLPVYTLGMQCLWGLEEAQDPQS